MLMLAQAAQLAVHVCLSASMLLALIFIELPRRALRQLTGASKPAEFESILITGASVGIGAGLARTFARPGVRMTLTALQKPSLDRTVKECRELGAEVDAHYVDVRDREAMQKLVATSDAARPLDLVIANAGIAPQQYGIAESHAILETNLLGAINTVVPAVEAFRAHADGRRRQIVMLSSLGSFAPATNAFMLPYVASKTAIRTYAEGLRMCLAAERIGVTVVCPGFVESRMVALHAKLGVGFLGLWPTERACSTIAHGVRANDPIVAFPGFLFVLTSVAGALPAFFRDLLGQRLLGSLDPYVDMEQRSSDNASKNGARQTVSLNEDAVHGTAPESVVMVAGRAALLAGAAAAVVVPAYLLYH